MEVPGSSIKQSGRRSLALSQYHMESENRTQENFIRRRHHHTPLSTPPVHSSTPISGDGDWRQNFSVKSPNTSNHTSSGDWSMQGDSGYVGLDSSRDRFSTTIRKEQYPMKGWSFSNFLVDILHSVQRKVTGRPSFLDSEGGTRWKKIKPQQILVCIVFCIITASIGFSVLISYKHIYSSQTVKHSNGKYRSIQHGSSGSSSTEKNTVVTPTSVLDTLDEFERQFFYEDPSFEDAKEDTELTVEDIEMEIEDDKQIDVGETEEENIDMGLDEHGNKENKLTRDEKSLKIKQLEEELGNNLKELRKINLEVELQKSKTELLAKIKSFPPPSPPNVKRSATTKDKSTINGNKKEKEEKLVRPKISENLEHSEIEPVSFDKSSEARKVKSKRTKNKNPLIGTSTVKMTRATSNKNKIKPK